MIDFQRRVNSLVLMVILFVVVHDSGCSKTHRTAFEVYESGKMGDRSDWILLVDNHDEGKRIFYYKFDSSLFLIKAYYDTSNIHERYQFFLYRGRSEGIFSIFSDDSNSAIMAINHLRNNLKEGFSFVYYDDGKLKQKEYYEHDSELYRLEYNEAGKLVDSIYRPPNPFGTLFDNDSD